MVLVIIYYPKSIFQMLTTLSKNIFRSYNSPSFCLLKRVVTSLRLICLRVPIVFTIGEHILFYAWLYVYYRVEWTFSIAILASFFPSRCFARPTKRPTKMLRLPTGLLDYRKLLSCPWFPCPRNWN